MKKLLTLFIALCFISVQAQKIKVSEGRKAIGGGMNNALTVSIYGASNDDIMKEWKSMMKNYKGKVSTKKDEMFADDVEMKSMGENSFDVYASARTKDNETEFVVAFDLGGAFLNSGDHSAKYKVAEELVKDFGIKMTKKALEDQLKEQEKVLKRMESDQKDLVKEKEGMEKDIENYQKKIKSAEESIVKNKEAQEKKLKEIEAQKKAVSEAEGKIKKVD